MGALIQASVLELGSDGAFEFGVVVVELSERELGDFEGIGLVGLGFCGDFEYKADEMGLYEWNRGFVGRGRGSGWLLSWGSGFIGMRFVEDFFLFCFCSC